MKKPQETQDKVFKLPDDRLVVYVPAEPNGSEWVQKDYQEPIELTEQELNKAKAFGYDLEKVLSVKIGLVKKMKSKQIEKDFKVSRKSIYNYRNILCKKHIETLQKHSQNTEKVKNGFPIWLIPCFLSAENPPYYSWGFLLLFFFFIWLFLVDEWEQQKQARVQHRKDTANLRRLFLHVFDLTYLQYPIVVNSKKEADNWIKILKHYNNSGRMVYYIERRSIQDNSQHWNEKEKFASDYSKANRHRIKEGNDRSDEEWQRLEDLGLLDYFYYSRKDLDTFEISKEYLLKSVKFYAENMHLPTEDKAKKKQIIEFIPGDIKTFNNEIN